jgi:hypothetical protein
MSSEPVPIAFLRRGESLRRNGEDQEHIRRLAESDPAQLPPVLVHRPTMRVIDGMHRIRAAALSSRDWINVVYFDGTSEEAFARAVEANVRHGLPLSLADRQTAAVRILASQPGASDRAVAAITGLSPKTVGAIRSRSSEEIPQLKDRLGRDGRRRPVDAAEGRRRAAEAIASRPRASLREIAKLAGVSTGTARSVREQLRAGRAAIPGPGPGSAASRGSALPEPPGSKARPGPEGPPARADGLGRGGAAGQPPDAQSVLEKLRKDPSLRHSQAGRALLRWLHAHMLQESEWHALSCAIPRHSVPLIASLARRNANSWEKLASELERRSRTQDGLAATASGE